MLNLPKLGRFFRKFRENRLLKRRKNDDTFIYQNLDLRRGNSFTRGVRMGPYSVAHPQYLLSPPGVNNEHATKLSDTPWILPWLYQGISLDTLTDYIYSVQKKVTVQ